MNSSRDVTDLHKSLGLLISIGEKLVDKCEEHKDISGVGKLLKNCKAELNYLKKLSQKEKFSEAVLKSSNLSNLQGIALCAEHLSNVVAVLRPLQMANSPHPIVVDVVCNRGRTWVKVITKNSKALLANVNEQCHFGTRSIREQATKYLEFAKLHPFQFKVPEVMFVFFHPVPQKMEDGLSRLGILVKRSEEVVPKELLTSELCCNIFKNLGISREGSETYKDFDFDDGDEDDSDSFDDGRSDEYDVDGDEDDGDDEAEESYDDREKEKTVQNFVSLELEDSSANPPLAEYPEMIATTEFLESICANSRCICKNYINRLSDNSSNVFPLVDRVNLDVTSLIAIVSNLCHGHCEFKFREHYLTLQARDEQSNPTLPKIFELFLGRSLFSCQTAVHDFEKIVSIVGGSEEKDRAKQLLKGIFVVPDLSSGKCDKLQESARINPRMRTIFGTGDSLKAVTCTANNGFVRASKQAGVEFVAFIHPARALTEQKQDSVDTVKLGEL